MGTSYLYIGGDEAMDDQIKRLEKRPHQVKIEDKKRVTVTAVEDVDSFNENEVIFLSSAGMMTITGDELHITKFSIDDGVLIVDGKIEAVDYTDHEEIRMVKSGLLGKVFK